MTNPQWKERMELAEASVISSDCVLCHSRSTGCWVLIGFGNVMNDEMVGIMTGISADTRPELPCTALMYPWGTRVELADYLGITGICNSAPTDVFAEAILDRVIAETWDKSKDSPSFNTPELMLTETI